MSEPLANHNATPPDWLPDLLDSTWVFFSDYPIVLSLIIMTVGLILAVAARKFILVWGSKITARTTTDLDEKLFQIVARVAALAVAYIALVAAIQVLPLGETAERVVIRLMMSLLILQLIRAAMGSESENRGSPGIQSGWGVPHLHYPKFYEFMVKLANAKRRAVLVEKLLPSVLGGQLIQLLKNGRGVE